MFDSRRKEGREEPWAKLAAMERALAPVRGLLVALSGGVDSSLVLAAARRSGCSPVVAVTAESILMQGGEVDRAREVARQVGLPHRVLALDPLAEPAVRANPPDRCYHCKRLVFTALVGLAREEGLAAVADGSNADDARSRRPGRRATAELGVLSPLAEVGLVKDEIRYLAAALELPTANAPALACLASRVPYGEPLEPARLRRIDRAEAALRALVPGQLRVRDHFPLARVELEPAALGSLVREPTRGRVLAALREAGYRYVTADLEGYRSGAMDEVLEGVEAEEP